MGGLGGWVGWVGLGGWVGCVGWVGWVGGLGGWVGWVGWVAINDHRLQDFETSFRSILPPTWRSLQVDPSLKCVILHHPCVKVTFGRIPFQRLNLGVGQNYKTSGPQVLVLGSIYHGSILGTYL